MAFDETRERTITPPQSHHTGEVCMVNQERWMEIRWLLQEEPVSLSEIAWRLDLDRKTVRRSLRQATEVQLTLVVNSGRHE
jgi:DNA-binding transcriptional regulator LsrR (DeoR family)